MTRKHKMFIQDNASKKMNDKMRQINKQRYRLFQQRIVDNQDDATNDKRNHEILQAFVKEIINFNKVRTKSFSETNLSFLE